MFTCSYPDQASCQITLAYPCPDDILSQPIHERCQPRKVNFDFDFKRGRASITFKRCCKCRRRSRYWFLGWLCQV